MAMPEFTLRQLLEAGVHFGHHTRRWNPRMGPYLYGVRNQVHIIDLQQTVPLLDRALRAIRDITAAGGRVLLVGTKRAAAEYVADAAKRCGQYYVNHRWLGGTLTNWKTITGSIKRLRQIEEMLGGNIEGLTKKEILEITRDKEKLDRALGGIKEMGGLPDILFIIDTNKEKLAVEEANKLHIPVVAILDSNSDPTGVTYPVPGNDDAIRAITMYCDLVPGAVLDGISAEMAASGQDLGAVENLPPEAMPDVEAPRSRQRLTPRATPGTIGDGTMPEITAALVKDLREKTGAGMMDCKKALTETGGDIGSRGGLAAQEGPRRRGEEVRPRRRRRAGRHRLGAGPCGDGRGQRRDRLRRPQRDVPGLRRGGGADRADRRRGPRCDQGGAVPRHRPHGGRRTDPTRRDDRREHEPAPRPRAERRQRRGRDLRAQRAEARAWARSACWWRSRAPARWPRWKHSAGRSACISPRAGRRQWISTASIPPRWSARRRC